NIALSQNKNLDFRFQRDGRLQNLGNTNIAYSPNVVGGSNFLFLPSTQLQVGLLSKYVGKQYMGNIDADLSILPDYFTQDLSVTYSTAPLGWTKGIDFSLLINNIFNEKFESNGYFYTFDDTWSVPGQTQTIEGVGYYPQAGTNFLLGATVKF
ncbi:MAG: TonB-dependent receptor, partial [Flavobacteriaceae bacterium]